MHSERCCNDPACVHSVAAAASAEASKLSVSERQIILGVLKRNEQLHKDQQQRIVRLQAELQVLRQKGAIRVDDPNRPDPDRSCGRCRIELGRVINRGATCRACRLRVCKSCRIYHLSGSEWVCTVCHKYMEIQAATGEWMNEFVRRPSRRRDNRVYNPSTDIIKRSIRRSWTISSPSTRWSFMRGNQEFRPYSSLPRCNDINNYPSLVAHQQQQHQQAAQLNKAIIVAQTTQEPIKVSSFWRHHSPAKRTQSEDVYVDAAIAETPHLNVPPQINLSTNHNNNINTKVDDINSIAKRETSPKPRINPLIKYANERKAKLEESSDSDASDDDKSMDLLKTIKTKRKLQHAKSDGGCDTTRLTVKKPLETSKSEDHAYSGVGRQMSQEKRVSFSAVSGKDEEDNKRREDGGQQERNRDSGVVGTTTAAAIAAVAVSPMPAQAEIHLSEREEGPIELCDIEPISGTVFRKVTVRRRRQDMRKMPAVDTGWRRGGAHDPDLLDILLPEGDDYKLVFISSDSSSKEEDPDDCDSTTTSSSYPIDECDWDYFEPGSHSKPMLSWTSPFGSPSVYRKGIDSPLGSPLVYRRSVRESGTDTGTDEDIVRFDTQSPSSSSSRDVEEPSIEDKVRNVSTKSAPAMEEAASSLQCVHQESAETPQRAPCQSCGGSSTQYVPIPVPVPIPIPMPQWHPHELVLYTPETLEALRNQLRVLPRALCTYLNQAAVIWPLINAGEPNPFIAALQASQIAVGPLENINEQPSNAAKAPDVPDQQEVQVECTTTTDVRQVNSSETPTGGRPTKPPDEQVLAPTSPICNKIDDEMRFIKHRLNDGACDQVESDQLGGHLECDSKEDYSSSSMSDDSESLYECNENRAIKHKTGSYDISGSKVFHSGEVAEMPDVPSSSDSDEMSISEESDSSHETKKKKRSFRMYVVNEVSSSEHSSSLDNDTDPENTCEIILTHIKHLDDDNDENELSIPAIKPVISDAECDSAVCDDQCFDKTDILDDSDSPQLSDVSADRLSLNSDKEEVLSLNSRSNSAAAGLETPRQSEWNCDNNALPLIRSDEPVTAASCQSVEVEGLSNEVDTRCLVEQAGVARTAVDSEHESNVATSQRHATNNGSARYTSLIMITQDTPPPASTPLEYSTVSVITSDTTTFVASGGTGSGDNTGDSSDIVVRHTNWQDERATRRCASQDPSALDCVGGNDNANAYFTLTLENASASAKPPVVSSAASEHTHRSSTIEGSEQSGSDSANNKDVTVVASSDTLSRTVNDAPGAKNTHEDNVTVITGNDTLSAVVCLEEGLADDDSWVEDLSHDDQDLEDSNDDSSSGEEVLHCTVAIDHEDELRGYHRTAIDFTLHTIVEESCEDSEVETTNTKRRPQSATDLEKYFFFGLGDGSSVQREDALSETSSICSESMDSYVGAEETTNGNETDPADLASSRLEKYFLSGFTSFKAERRDSDGSVGSDSEGKPSPEQRRKRLVRARGTGRSHSSSLDNLIVSNPDLTNTEGNDQLEEDSSSSDSDTYDESNFDKNDGQFDTVKRKKNKKRNGTCSPSEETKPLETTQELNEDLASDEEGHKTPQPSEPFTSDFNNRNKQQSRDSGFIGSNDDLNKDTRDNNNEQLPSDNKSELKMNLYNISEEKRAEERLTDSTPPATSLTRKDSFNNWSSDEETNLMMCKMRQFFKTMVAANNNSKPTTPVMARGSPKPVPSPRLKARCKPPQLVYFESELTRLMKTVPGIREDQVREIVEYLSSEDTWSDSYDSSDYTSSDLEGTAVCSKSVLQQQISDSCKQIINKFDTSVDDEGDEGDGGILDESHGLNRETAFVYQKLVASFEKIATGDSEDNKTNSPPLIAKVMHHIGSRLVALMHEVSSGESHASNSPKQRYHRRLQQKLSSSTTTTEDDDSTSDSNLNDKLSALEDVTPYNLLPRSRSHDLLMSEGRGHHQSVSDIAEERETSDCERFSWRGSFESALLATDSRNKLSLIGGEGSASVSALAIAAKRRSAGDLLFSNKSLSREQLDRVRSCGSIGGANSEDKLWVTSGRSSRRRSSVPDASCGSGGSADGEDDEDDNHEHRSTLPRSLQSSTATTNSLPRLPTNTAATSMQKAQSMYHFPQQNNVKSARYRPPGFNRLISNNSVPKRAVSAPGLQPTPQRRGRRQQPVQSSQSDDISISEAHSSPMLTPRATTSATPSPIAHKTSRSLGGSQEWHSNEEDIDRLVAIHSKRSSLSNLGTRSDSMASVYSGAGEGRYGTVAVRGQVEFGLQYNYKAGALEINVKQCRDLAAVDVKRNRSDPYVKVYLLPDKSKSGKRKTKVKKHTLNPVFDECLKFHMSLSGLETRTLWLTVWHSDMFGRNDFLGEVMMTLENKVFDDPTPMWYNLQERTEPFDDLSFKGDILVGLKFVPPDMTVHKKGKRSRGSLQVLVKEAKSLTAVKANGTSDPFCKSYLLPDKGRHSKQKTSVIRRTVNPVWNHTFIYEDVTLQELAERCLELTIWDHDRLASNEFIGGVRFSLGTGKTYGKSVDWMDATGKEMTLWKSMLERPNFWVEGCVSLRPTLEHRTT